MSSKTLDKIFTLHQSVKISRREISRREILSLLDKDVRDRTHVAQWKGDTLVCVEGRFAESYRERLTSQLTGELKSGIVVDGEFVEKGKINLEANNGNEAMSNSIRFEPCELKRRISQRRLNKLFPLADVSVKYEGEVAIISYDMLDEDEIIDMLIEDKILHCD